MLTTDRRDLTHIARAFADWRHAVEMCGVGWVNIVIGLCTLLSGLGCLLYHVRWVVFAGGCAYLAARWARWL